MKALVLEKKLELNLRDIDLPSEIGPDDVKIKMHTVGICGSDIHYYEHGKIGQWNVRCTYGSRARGFRHSNCSW